MKAKNDSKKNKNEKTSANSGGGNTPPVPAPAAPGSKANPYTSETLPPDYDENKGKYANAFFKTKGSQDNPSKVVQFDAEGKCELRGNWKGTAHEGRGDSKDNKATRLYNLFNGKAVATRLNGESDADFAARQKQVEIGNIMAKAIAGKIEIKLAKVEGGKLKRNLTIEELKAKPEFAGVPDVALSFMQVPFEEEIQPQEERVILCNALQPHHTLAAGEESRVRGCLVQATGAAFRVSAS